MIRFKPSAAIAVAVFCAHLVLARGAVLLASHVGAVAPIWPAAGLGLGAVLLWGDALLLPVFLAVFLSKILGGAPLVYAVMVASGDTLSTYLAARLLERLIGGRVGSQNLQAALPWVLPVALAQAVISAVVGIAGSLAGGLMHVSQIGLNTILWTLADVFGVLFVTPLMLSWVLRPFAIKSATQVWEFGCLVLFTVGAMVFLTFGLPGVQDEHVPRGIFVFPFLVWVAARFGAREITAVLMVLALFFATWIVKDIGPLAGTTPLARAFYAIGYLSVLSLTVIFLNALWLTKRQTQEELASSRAKSFSILRALPDLVVIQDRDGRYRLDEVTLTGSVPFWDENIVRLGMSSVYPARIIDLRLAALRRVIDSGEPEVIDYPLNLPDRSYWLEARIVRYDAEHALSLIRDITARKEAEFKFRLISENISDVVFLYEPGTSVVRYASPSVRRVLGYTPEEIVGQDICELIHPEDMPRVRGLRIRSEAGLDTSSIDYRMRHRDGRYLWIATTGQTIFDEQGGVLSRITCSRNTTERHELEERLQLAAVASNTSTEGVLVTDAHGRVLWANESFLSIAGLSANAVIGEPASSLLSYEMTPEQGQALREAMARGSSWQGEVNALRRDGKRFPAQRRTAVVRGPEGDISKIVHQIADQSRQRLAEEKVAHLYRHDPLTQLLNRATLVEELRAAIDQAPAERPTVALLTINMDRFKRINSTFGTDQGDVFLCQIAQRLSSTARSAAAVARIAADEFAVLLRGANVTAEAARGAWELISALALPFDLGGAEPVFATASIGIALFPRDATSVDDLIKASSTAVRAAKRVGGNTYRFFSGQMEVRDSDLLALENRLRRAVATHEGFSLRYQPKVRVATREVTGVEALLRWRTPEGQEISPADFIPLAEELGLIRDIGEWVLREACAEAVQLARDGLGHLTMAVNLSARQLADDNLPRRIQAILQETGLPAERLELEVTETSMMAAREQAVELLASIRELGVAIALDDFGTGFSSLSYLSSLPIGTVKIDRSFVSGLPQKSSAVAISKAVLAMSQALSLKVVGEGVETAEELRFLEENGCDEVQGYLFAKPLTAAELRDYLLTEEKVA